MTVRKFGIYNRRYMKPNSIRDQKSFTREEITDQIEGCSKRIPFHES
jgi:hypothetical protein